MLNSLLQSGFSQVDYKAKSKFVLKKSLKNNILIEVNMSALSQTYDLDEDLFKDTIGNLNWKKFSERLSDQLNTNANLTFQQRQLLEVNQIVALILAEQFEQAREEWQKKTKSNNHPAMRVIDACFYLKDKEYEKALMMM